MEHSVLMHETDDDVGVAIADLRPGAEVGVITIEGTEVGTVKVTQDIPLGHKVAMRDLPEGKEVIKYGRHIGRAVKPITRGMHVHTHNVKSLRW